MEDMDLLSELYLDGTAIRELPISMNRLSGLTLLDLRDCKDLLILPNFICSLTSLKVLNISGCSQVQKLPETLESLKQLEKFDACRTAIREAPSSILLLNNIKTLCFTSCNGVPLHKSLYSGSRSINFQLPNSFSGLSSLTSLNLSKCNLQAIPEDIHHLSSLQGLDLSKNNFICLPRSISKLSKLKLVRLNKCRKLQSLPKLPKSIQYVQAYGCPKLHDQTIIWASNNGFSFIDSRKLLKVRRAAVFHDLPLPEEFIPIILQPFIQEIIYHGMNLEICFPYTRIPEWISDWIDESSISIDVPLQDYSQTWMGIAIFAVFKVMEHNNFNEYWYSKETVCEFSIGDCCVGRFVIESLKKFGVGSYVLCIYVPQKMFAKRLKQLICVSHIQASVLTDRPDVEVKMCGKHVVYCKDVPEFTQNLVQTSKEHQRLSSFEHYMYLLNLARRGESSLDSKKLHQSNRYPIPRYEGFTTTHLTSQVRISLRSLLSRIFFKGSCYARNESLVVHFPVQAYVSSWLFHQSLGRVVVCYLPRNLFDDKSWVGFCIYVGLKMHPSYLHNINLDLESHHKYLFVDLYSHGNITSYITTMSSFPILQKSHQTVLFHIPRVKFKEEMNQCWGVSALSWTSIPHVEVEICGIRLIYEHDLENEVEVIIDISLSGPDDECRHQLNYQSLSELVEGLVGKIECGEQKTRKEEMSIHSGYSSERKYKSLQENKCLLSMAQPVDKQVFTAYEQFSVPSDPIILHSMNALFESSHEMNASIDSMIPFAHLQIMAETPLYTNNLEMWKANLEDSLKQYCCSKFYITLSLRGHIISALKPFIPSTTYNLCFPRKETLRWFKQFNHSDTQRLVIRLPQNLITDIKWRGLAVCVAFSVDDHQSEIHEIEDLDISFRVLCHLNTAQGRCLNSAPSFRISKDKFKWLYVGGFIWLTYVPHWLLLGELNEQSSLEVNIYNECPGVITQSLDAVLLYQQDVEEFRQSIAQCMTSFFSNLDLIQQYIDDENTNPSHA
ncbi:uncharacterized protein LOC112493116 [Ziziphus jujuba]|uniref:Uncharacterized protein LOC112493116 n=1 Tax=Ziziphus jujuba TaxID=326968 RepID=A0A6P6GI77_ZIZJJ|nr:uncharacterized protein LOC112493116 [Ziziphus jujuba]XP_048318203.1 uncharacterized protein LOC112493116 [Ziziphus jujuba var. spinosa]